MTSSDLLLCQRDCYAREGQATVLRSVSLNRGLLSDSIAIVGILLVAIVKSSHTLCCMEMRIFEHSNMACMQMRSCASCGESQGAI